MFGIEVLQTHFSSCKKKQKCIKCDILPHFHIHDDGKSEKSNRKFGSYKHNFDVIHLLINWYPLSHDIWWLFFRYKNLSLLIVPKIKQKTHQISIFHKCLMKYYMIHTWYQTNLNIDISYNTWVLDYLFKNSIKYHIIKRQISW